MSSFPYTLNSAVDVGVISVAVTLEELLTGKGVGWNK
jgi:hypothetical protein